MQKNCLVLLRSNITIFTFLIKDVENNQPWLSIKFAISEYLLTLDMIRRVFINTWIEQLTNHCNEI